MKPKPKTPAPEINTQKQIEQSTLDILLTEMNIITSRWEHSDQIAESRMNLLLTSTFGAVGALIFLDQLDIPISNIREVRSMVFFIIWMLSILTFVRMLDRNVVGVQSNKALQRIRKYLGDIQPQLNSVLDLPKKLPSKPAKKNSLANIHFFGSRTIAIVIGSIALGMLSWNASILLWGDNIHTSIIFAYSLFLGVAHFILLEIYATSQINKL